MTDRVVRYRTGTKVLRTIYQVNPDGDDTLIGMLDTAELAAMFVDAANREVARERLDQLRAEVRKAAMPDYPDRPDEAAEQAAVTHAMQTVQSWNADGTGGGN